MLSATISLRSNGQAELSFVDKTNLSLQTSVAAGGLNFVITSKRHDGAVWSYNASTMEGLDEDIISPQRGNVSLRTLLQWLASELDLSLDISNITSWSALDTTIYTGFFNPGTISAVLSTVCNTFMLSWYIYHPVAAVKPTLRIVHKASTNLPPIENALSVTYDTTMQVTPYLAVITTPEITESTEAVLGDGPTDFEPETVDFTEPSLSGTSVPTATIKEWNEETEECEDVPFDQWKILERELAITGDNSTWEQKAPLSRWTVEQRQYNQHVVEAADCWPLYWFDIDGLQRTLPAEGKVRILSTVLDTGRQTKAQAFADYPKLTYILPGRQEVWSWVGVWPEIGRYDARVMDEHYNEVLVWRGDKKHNRQADWGEENA